MGMPSVGILLHEIIKLMFHAKVVDPVFFRIGTSGGIGLEGGTVIISDEAVDGTLQPYLELVSVPITFCIFYVYIEYWLNFIPSIFHTIVLLYYYYNLKNITYAANFGQNCEKEFSP